MLVSPQSYTFMNLLMFFTLNLFAKGAFTGCAYLRRYGHGKTWKRGRKHFKKNWTFWQRTFWVFVFKEKYEACWRALAWFFYIHLVITLFMPFLSPLMDAALADNVKWYAWNNLARELLAVFWLIRYLYIIWLLRTHEHSRKNKKKH